MLAAVRQGRAKVWHGQPNRKLDEPISCFQDEPHYVFRLCRLESNSCADLKAPPAFPAEGQNSFAPYLPTYLVKALQQAHDAALDLLLVEAGGGAVHAHGDSGDALLDAGDDNARRGKEGCSLDGGTGGGGGGADGRAEHRGTEHGGGCDCDSREVAGEWKERSIDAAGGGDN